MESKKQTNSSRWQWRNYTLQIIAVIISIVALTITVIMNMSQQRSNQSQFATVQARLGKLDQPNITAKIKVAFSPNYSQPLDQQYLDQVGMKVKNAGYEYYNQSLEQYLNGSAPDQARYLFFQFMNEGPGIAKHIKIDKITWAPKEGATAPAGLEQAANVDFGIINPDQMLTLLVDVSTGLGPANLETNSNAQEICVEFSYTNYLEDTQWIKGKPLCLSTAGPGTIEPMGRQ